MATSSSWRSSNGPRWSQGGNNSNHQGSNNVNAASNTSNQPSRNGGDTASPSPVPASFPPLGVKGSIPSIQGADAIQRDRMLYLLVGLVGNTVVATTKSGAKYVGVLSSTSVPGDGSESLGIILSSAQQILQDSALGPLKKMLVIKGEDLDGFSAKDVGLDVPVSMGSANRAGFRTDTEISKKVLEPFGSEGRTLQRWADDPDFKALDGDAGTFGESSGATTGGSSGGLGGWDQFAANEARFGIKSNYEETLYTTKLDKSSKDFKDREKRAEQLAREIMNSSTNNIHVAEERNITEEGQDGQTEEDRYGAVVRGPNAYVPPAARRAAAVAAAAEVQSTIKANGAAREDKANGGQVTSAPTIQISTIASAPTAKEGNETEASLATQATPDAVGEFRQFVTSERERMEKKKAALAKKEKDTKLADLKNWGDKFKLKFPSENSEGKDGEATDKPRNPSLQKSFSPTAAHLQEQAKVGDGAALAGTGGTASVMQSPASAFVGTKASAGTETATNSNTTTQARLADTKAMLAKMTIPKIPPFNPEKARAKQSEAAAVAAASVATPTTASSSKTSFKLSAKASSFKPFNPNAAAFTPGGGAGGGGGGGGVSPAVLTSAAASSTFSPRVPSAAASSVTSPVPVAVRLPTSTTNVASVPTTPVNAFFGNRVFKKPTTSIYVREDFNPFKNGKVPESQTIGPTWGFTGKGYRNLFQVVPAEESVNVTHMNQLPHLPPMATPVHNMIPMAIHPHGSMVGQQGPPGPVPQPHLQQQQQQHNPMAANNGQPFYMPYGGPQGSPYRFQGGVQQQQQQQPMQQIPGNYGQMPPHYLPFSPPMPQSGPPVYSPQMGNMFPPNASMHTMGVPPSQQMAPLPRNGGGGGPGMQGKGNQHMYYSNAPSYPPNPAAGPPGAMSPNIRHQQHPPPLQQQQQHQLHHQQQQSLPPHPPPPQSQGPQSSTASQSGSTAG